MESKMVDKSKTNKKVDDNNDILPDVSLKARKDIREQFRAPLNIRYLHDLPSHLKEPGFVYRRIRTHYKTDPYRIDRCFEMGWEMVLTDGNEVCYLGNATKNKDNIRLSPIEVTSTVHGIKSFWMRIPQERFDEIREERREKRLQQQRRSVTRKSQGDSVREQDNDIYDPDTNV
jgi:hypothetical protein